MYSEWKTRKDRERPAPVIDKWPFRFPHGWKLTRITAAMGIDWQSNGIWCHKTLSGKLCLRDVIKNEVLYQMDSAVRIQCHHLKRRFVFVCVFFSFFYRKKKKARKQKTTKVTSPGHHECACGWGATRGRWRLQAEILPLIRHGWQRPWWRIDTPVANSLYKQSLAAFFVMQGSQIVNYIKQTVKDGWKEILYRTFRSCWLFHGGTVKSLTRRYGNNRLGR